MSILKLTANSASPLAEMALVGRCRQAASGSLFINTRGMA